MRRRRNQQPRQQQPPPPEPTIGIKDDGPAPEGTHDVRPTLHVLTTPVSHEKVLRGEGEKARGAQPLDSDAHHIAEKSDPDPRARRAREVLDVSGVSKNDEANLHAARGLPRDPRAPLESSAQRWGLHTDENRKQLLRELQTVQGDDEAMKAVLRRHGLAQWEGRKLDEIEFALGPDVDDPDLDDE